MQRDAGSIRSSGRELTLVAAYDGMCRHTAFDGEGIQKALDFELLALESGADPSWGREQLVGHQRRCAGRKGGLATYARYGRPYYRALARARWGKTPSGALPAIRDALKSPEGTQKRLSPQEATSGDREEIAA